MANHGYRTGVHAPGLRDPEAARAATHHLLVGHGLAAQALRSVLPAGTPVGITLDLHPVLVPDGTHSDAVEQARLATDAELNGLYLDPLLHGRYPSLAREVLLPARVADGRRRPGHDQPAHRLPRGQLLLPGLPARGQRRRPAARRGAGPLRAARRGRVPPGRAGPDPDGLARRPRRALRPAAAPLRGRARAAAVHHRERLRRRGLHEPGGRGERRGADQVPAPAPGGRGPRRQGRGPAGRLLRLVPAGQLRVGLGLPAAIRHRVRRLRDPAPHPQVERQLLLPGGARERGAVAGGQRAA